MDDNAFASWWPNLTAEEQSAIGSEGYSRYRKIMGDINRGNGSRYEIPDTVPLEPIWPEPVDLERLAVTAPEPPKFIIPDWLPCGYATLFAGHGGVGKSGLALYLACCIALGRDFFGLPCEQRSVLYLSCEDREPVLHWRLARIAAHMGITLAELAGKLFVLDLVGRASILWERDPRTGATETAALAALQDRIGAYDAKVIMVDGINDTFAGNENARVDVKRYVNALVGLVCPNEGALVLIGHVAKESAKASGTTEGYSGSTGWHNAVRARWYLYPETRSQDGDERPQKTGDLLLELQKSNLGATDQSMRLTWSESDSLFVGREVQGRTAADRELRDASERRQIVSALADVLAIKGHCPAASQGAQTAYTALLASRHFPESLARNMVSDRKRFWRHISVLIQSGQIVEVEYRSGYRPRPGLSIPAQSNRQHA